MTSTMSQALYRRYRSQTFDELIGQEHIVQTLRNALAEGRIAHAYLFTGPRGVGKTTVARLLAKAVNCTADAADRPCGVCNSCQSIAEGRAVDVIELDAASHTSVDDAREIIERVQFRPSVARYKVYVFDEAHMLSTAAFNALLKTLEEPPDHVLFVLATTESRKIPTTIVSRCQRFSFNRHTLGAIAAHLRAVAAEEHITIEPGVAEAIGRAATGSMRDALGILDQLMAYGSGTITLEQVQTVIGSTDMQQIVAIVDALVEHNLASALQTVMSVADQGADMRQFARDLVGYMRSLMLIKAGGDIEMLDVSIDDRAILVRQAASSNIESFLRWTRLFSGLDHQLRTSPFGQLPIEMALVEAIAVSDHAERQQTERPTPRPERHVVDTPAALAAPPAQTLAKAKSAPTRAPIVAEHVPPAPNQEHANDHTEVAAANADAMLLEQIESAWEDILQGIRARDKTLYVLLTSSGGVRPIDRTGDVVTFVVKNEWQVKRIEQPNARRTIEDVLGRSIGASYRIRCVVEERSGVHPNILRDQIREARRDPHVKAVINIFDADIIGIEPTNGGT